MSERNQTANQALEQTRDSVLRYGEVVGCELAGHDTRRTSFTATGRPARRFIRNLNRWVR